jgi:predicted hotdog family 3-hydroxylacyl-ACP dehydratase
MRLLAEVVAHGPRETTCAVDVDASALFRRADGSVPAWLGLEYMAQCAAVHGGLASRERGQAPRPGLFLGSRRVRFAVEAFPAGARLRVTARHHRGETGLAWFDCSLRDERGGRTLAEGRLSVYVFDDWSALEEAIR